MTDESKLRYFLIIKFNVKFIEQVFSREPFK